MVDDFGFVVGIYFGKCDTFVSAAILIFPVADRCVPVAFAQELSKTHS